VVLFESVVANQLFVVGIVACAFSLSCGRSLRESDDDDSRGGDANGDADGGSTARGGSAGRDPDNTSGASGVAGQRPEDVLPPLLTDCPCPSAEQPPYVTLTSTTTGETFRFVTDQIGYGRAVCEGAEAPPLTALVELGCPSLSLAFSVRTDPTDLTGIYVQGGYAQLLITSGFIDGDIRYTGVHAAPSEHAMAGLFEFVPWPEEGLGSTTYRGTFSLCVEAGQTVEPCRNLPPGDAGAP